MLPFCTLAHGIRLGSPPDKSIEANPPGLGLCPILRIQQSTHSPWKHVCPDSFRGYRGINLVFPDGREVLGREACFFGCRQTDGRERTFPGGAQTWRVGDALISSSFVSRRSDDCCLCCFYCLLVHGARPRMAGEAITHRGGDFPRLFFSRYACSSVVPACPRLDHASHHERDPDHTCTCIQAVTSPRLFRCLLERFASYLGTLA